MSISTFEEWSLPNNTFVGDFNQNSFQGRCHLSCICCSPATDFHSIFCQFFWHSNTLEHKNSNDSVNPDCPAIFEQTTQCRTFYKHLMDPYDSWECKAALSSKTYTNASIILIVQCESQYCNPPWPALLINHKRLPQTCTFYCISSQNCLLPKFISWLWLFILHSGCRAYSRSSRGPSHLCF